MDFLLARKNVLLLIGCLLLFCVVLILYAFSLLSSKTQSPGDADTSPSSSSSQNQRTPLFTTPLPTFVYSQDYINQTKKTREQDAALLQRDAYVSKFEDKLPYQGKYISVYYTRDINQVVLMLNPSHQTEANAEFDALLKKYQIESRSWFPNLVSALMEPTPGP